MRWLLTALAILFFLHSQAQFSGLVVNEFSQGDAGNREYIELLVYGTRTCTDSTADLRGWIVDDQSGWYGITNASPGHYRFSNNVQWASVPIGSIILLYNAADKNVAITLADDPSDSNHDYIYVLPIGNPQIEQNTSEPDNLSGAGYSYPPASATTNYTASNNQWGFVAGLNNTGGDVISTVSPANRSAAYFSIANGYAVVSPFQTPMVSIAATGAGNNAYLTGSAFNAAGSWTIGNAGVNESPGLPNSNANQSWITNMRTQQALPAPTVSVNQPSCFNATGGIIVTSPNGNGYGYSINGSDYSNTFAVFTGLTAGSYPVTVRNSAGCVSPVTSVTINPQPQTPSTPVVTVIQPDCNTPTGTILINSPLGSSIVYSVDAINYNPSTVISGLAPSSLYGVSAKDTVGGCLSAASAIVSIDAAPPSFTITVSSNSVCGNPTVTLSTAMSNTGTYVYTWTVPAAASNPGNVASFNTTIPGTYIVSASSNGCSSADTIQVNIPVAGSVIADDKSVCENGMVVLTAQPTGGSWSGAGVNGNDFLAAGMPPGNHEVVYSITTGGCTIKDTAVVTVVASPAVPQVTVSNGCNGSSTLTAINYMGSLTWSNGATSPLITVTTAGTYSVFQTVNGCISASASAIASPANALAAPTATVTTQPGCQQPTGTITVSLPAPGSGYGYSIDGTNYSNSSGIFTGLTPGSYSVTVQNGAGCISPATTVMVMSAPAAPAAPSVTVSSPGCTTTTGGITINSPTGSGFTYSIDGVNYFTSNLFPNLAPNSYLVTVKDINGCVSVSTAAIIQPPPSIPGLPSFTATSPSCGGSVGNINITSPTGGGLQYSLDGVNYQASPLFNNLAPSTYTITVKNPEGCISPSATAIIASAPSSPVVSVNSPSVCAGMQATVSATTSTGSYSYTWTVPAGATDPGNVSSFNTTVAGAYSITVTNASGCSATASGTVTITPAAAVTADNAVVCENGMATLTGQPAGGSWSGTGVSGNIFNANGLAPGSYPVTYQSGSGNCSGSATAMVTVQALPSPPTVAVNDHCNGTSTLQASNFTGSLTWSTGQTTSLITVTAAGTYSVSQTINGCTSPLATAVANPLTSIAAPTGSVTTQPGCTMNTGTITIDVLGGLAYSLDGINYNNFNGVFSSLSAGSYSITAQNNAGCISSPLILVVSPAPGAPQQPLLNVIQPDCGTSTGSIQVSAPLGSGFSYSIDGISFVSSTTFNPVSPGTYTVFVKDGGGCTSAGTNITIQAAPDTPAAPVVVIQHPACGATTGTINISSPSGAGWQYCIDGVQYGSSASISNLAPGSYSVTVKSPAGCISASSTITINAPLPAPSVSVNSPTICPGAQATVTATTSTGNYTYVWSVPAGVADPGNVASFTTSAAGNYSVVVSSGPGCSATASGTISFASAANVTAANAQVCEGGSVVLSGQPAGGTWSGIGVSGNNFNATNLAPGNYTVTYQYSSGSCSGSATAVVTINALPQAPVLTVTNNCNATSLLQASAYTGNLLWSNGSTGSSIIVTTAGSYTVSQTINGCTSASVSAVANPLTAPAAPSTLVTQPSCSSSSGGFIASSPATAGYSISGADYNNTTGQFSNLVPATYNVTAQGTNGCISSASTIVINPAPQPTATPQVTIVQPDCTNPAGTITVIAPAGVSYSYSLSVSAYQASPVFSAVSPGNYSLTAIAAGGCASAPLAITINPVSGTIHHYSTVCLPAGGSYNFNGQQLTTSGSYTAMYQQPGGCDSVEHLQLTVVVLQSQTISGCSSVTYNGNVYLNSTFVRDTLRSVTGCDSVITTTTVVVNQPQTTVINQCLPPGASFNFNGSTLTASGIYTSHLTTVSSCDSTITLNLTIALAESKTVSGCGSVLYKSILYTSSASLVEITPSILNGCDSVVTQVQVIVNTAPVVQVGDDKVICKGDSVLLVAMAPGATIQWDGYGAGNSIRVAPTKDTNYTVIATDINGCKDTASVSVSLHAFDLQLTADQNPVITGKTVFLQPSASVPYTVQAWLPLAAFPSQQSKSQYLVLDSSITVRLIAQSAEGCIDTASLVLQAELTDGIYIPDAFTPDGDGRNDLFRILGGSIRVMDLRIYNRWGETVFRTQERSRGWDGRQSGKDLPTGTYVYQLSCTLDDGRKLTRKGTVVLIR